MIFTYTFHNYLYILSKHNEATKYYRLTLKQYYRMLKGLLKPEVIFLLTLFYPFSSKTVDNNAGRATPCLLRRP